MTKVLDDATPAQLLQAVASNHRAWFSRIARAAGGGTRTEGGISVTYTGSPGGEVTLAFPRLATRRAGEQLDALMRYLHGVEGLRRAGVWALDERTSPPDLGIRLAARGFEIGWLPHWMWLDLRRLDDAYTPPDDLRVEIVQDARHWEVADLPYFDAGLAGELRTLAHARPRRVWHFGAWRGDRPVGQSVLNLTTGRYGVAGIYCVGVVPESRGQGIARALMVATLRHARNLDCRHALLNATGMGEPLYHSLGFSTLGHGITWWLHQDVLEQEPPAAIEVALGEAIGHGDLVILEALEPVFSPELLDTTMRCGLTPVQLAVQFRQPEVVTWLVEHGATLDVVSAWELGWKEHAVRLLEAEPRLANYTPGKRRLTPLHEAAARDDLELAQIVLAAAPNLEIADPMFQSTALGWARHFGRDQMIRLIEGWQGAGRG